MKFNKIYRNLVLIGASLSSATALAHSPYLLVQPSMRGDSGIVSVEASLTDHFFVPDIAFNNSQFEAMMPDGKTQALDRVEVWQARTLGEHRIENAQGTWRFSTGRREGAIFKRWEIDGKTHSSRDPHADIPASAKVLANFQSIGIAESYITIGEPSNTVLAPRKKGLEIAAISHPSNLKVGEPFQFRILFNGKPLPEQPIQFTEASSTNGGGKAHVVKLTTDKKGVASFTPEHAGHWVAVTRFRTSAPKSAGVAEYSHTYSLTLRSVNP